MKAVEEHAWDALANLLPALGRDFTVEITTPSEDNDTYRCAAVLTYLTDVGAAVIPAIAEKLNGEMLNVLTEQIQDEKRKKIILDSIGQSKVIDVQVVDGRGKEPEKKTEINEQEQNASEKLQGILEPSTSDPVHEDKDPSVLEFHWASVFKAYLPGPDIESFYAWIRRLLTIELNRRIVADKVKVYSLPVDFDKQWMEHVRLISADPVIAPYSALVNPNGFENIIDEAYHNLRYTMDIATMFSGTLKIGLNPVAPAANQPLDAVRVDIIYMAKEQNNQNQGE